MKQGISRRELLWAMAAAAGGMGLAATGRLLGPAAAMPGIDPTPDPSRLHTYLPAVIRDAGLIVPGTVIHVHDPAATHWTGETSYWEHVDQAAVDAMIHHGLMALTGTATVADAWRALLPGYQAGQKIAVKVNLNNARSCTEVDGDIDALMQPVNALVAGLEQIGVARADVCVYDAVRRLPVWLAAAALPGISLFDNGQCQTAAGFNANNPAARVVFHPPAGVSVADEIVNNVALAADYLINMPIVKGRHPLASVTLGYKNHFGTIHNPSGLHPLVDVVGGTARDDYNPLVDFYAAPPLGGKLVLTVGDALFGARRYSQAPEPWTTFGGQVPNSLFLSTDPVAADCVMHDFLKAELGSAVLPGSNRYLELAAAAGQGTFESVNPWTESYTRIRYQKIEL